MRLCGKLLQEIIGRADVHFDGNGSKRALGRLLVGESAMLFPIRDDLLEEAVEVIVRDISAESVGIIGGVAMMPGAGLVICLPRQEGEAVPVQCVVERCTSQGNGEFVIAAEFIRMLERDILPRGQNGR